jgi:hypothetical protein
VRCQTIGRDANAHFKARGYHPPANRTLQPDKTGDPEGLEREIRIKPARDQERDKRQCHGRANDAPEQPVAPFPEIDRLEFGKREPAMQRLILRNLAILLELRNPCSFSQWRQDTGDEFPFGNRQA